MLYYVIKDHKTDLTLLKMSDFDLIWELNTGQSVHLWCIFE